MISALKGALSGSLETVILGLMKSTAQFDASEIKASIKVKCGLFVFSLREILWKGNTALCWKQKAISLMSSDGFQVWSFKILLFSGIRNWWRNTDWDFVLT